MQGGPGGSVMMSDEEEGVGSVVVYCGRIEGQVL